jgi:diguanylate cyclase (GGDEF)-like protein
MSYRLLTFGPAPDLASSPWGPFEVHACESLDVLAQRLQVEQFDALLIAADAYRLAAWPALTHAVLDAAVVVMTDTPGVALATELLPRGVQDLVAAGVDGETVARHLRLAIERKRLDQAARKSYATDLATGLPNHQQLLEHMTHLLALREREPAPMALLAVRLDGVAATASSLGAESANVLRRKVAVRLRAALRASDVVAAVGTDAFVVLLAWMDSAADGEHVAAKLARTLHRPFTVTGHAVTLATSIAFSLYPEHGNDADALLRRAIGQAASAATEGGAAGTVRRALDQAANDPDGDDDEA